MYCVFFSDFLLFIISNDRVMAVLDPLKVTITNFPSDHPGEITVPDFPSDESKGSHKIPFNNVIYIERSDFREVSHWFC